MKSFGLGQEKEYFIEELSMLLISGMPVVTAFSAIKKDLKSDRLKKIIDEISTNIEAGSPISKALASADIFTPSTISLIRIGERSGRLSENLKVVASQQQKERDFRAKIASAMMYPVFVFSLTIIVGVGIAWFILPRLATVFAQLKIELPVITRWLISFGTFLGRYGTIVVPAFLLIGLVVVFLLFVYSKTNFLGQVILFAISPISKLLTEVELSRFGFLLGNLLGAGLPILDALDSLVGSTPFYRYKKLYLHLHDRIAEGNSFEKSFASFPNAKHLIPIPIQQLIITSEESGNLPETFKNIGEMYEQRTELTAKNVTVLLEPILLVVVWLGVLAVALAVILPLYSLLGGINQEPPHPVPAPIITTITPTPTPGVTAKKLKILSSGTGAVNIRKTPDLTAPIIGKATPGTTYEYSDIQNNWYQINTPSGVAGWVFGDYVEVEKNQ